MDVFEKKYMVTVGDVDTDRYIKPSVLFDFFQSLTTEHGEDLGVGLDTMLGNGHGWVLSRFSVLVYKRPRFADTLTIRTWPQGFDRLLCMRNYDVLDGSATLLARACSSWLVLDIGKRRPLRPEALTVRLPLNEGRPFLEGGARSLAKRDDLVKTAERTPLYSDIDFNGHVNNARYIQWIQDALPKDFIKNASRLRIDINYVNEVVLGETVEIYSSAADPDLELALEGRKVSDKQAVFRAGIKIGG
ncbi:MAG: acyl-ACP thioesterase [Spirochaetaceae bacterium]|jgi:acyl-ACP thioesterase|nr:acyl-ACP thioesterase [Spirochaetaceae bacterium]